MESVRQVANADAGNDVRWPASARVAVTVALLLHFASVVAAALALGPSSSPLERLVAEQFAGYYQLLNQGYSYNYYAPEPPPTPVVEAELHFADGRPDRTVRLPDPAARPRLMYQRQLALAHHLFTEWMSAREAEQASHRPEAEDLDPAQMHPAAFDPAAARLVWAPSYARHLGHVYGCKTATLYVKQHLIPDPQQMRGGGPGGAARRPSIDDESFYTVRQRIGDFPCDAS